MEIQKHHLCMFFFLFALFSDSQAYKFYVGGKNGWVLNPSENYNQWAERNRFQIGDTLVFKYQKGSDSVLVVNKDDYDKCNTKNPVKKYEDGDTEFKFDRSGPFYFISGKDGNCEKGQKLIILVISPRGKPSPSVPTPAKPPSFGGQPPVAQPPGGRVPVSPSGSPVHPPTAPAPAGNPLSPSVSPISQPPAGGPGKSPISPSPAGGNPAASPGPGNAPSYPSPRNSPAVAPTSPPPSSPSPAATSPALTPTALPPSPSAASPTASPPSLPASTPSPSSTTPGAQTPTSSPPGASSPASSNETAPSPPGGAGSSAWAAAPSSMLLYSVTIVLSGTLSTVLGAH